VLNIVSGREFSRYALFAIDVKRRRTIDSAGATPQNNK
jgi:hypothetical protein